MTKTNYLEYSATQIKSYRLRSSTPESSSEDLQSFDSETDESESEIPESAPVVVRRITWQSSPSPCTFPTHSFQSKSNFVYRHFEKLVTKIDESITNVLEPAPVREKLITWQNLPAQQKPLMYPPVNNHPLAVKNCANPATETNQSSITAPKSTDAGERPITGQNSSMQQMPLIYSSFDNHHYIYEERTDNSTRNVLVFISLFILIVAGLLFLFVSQRST